MSSSIHSSILSPSDSSSQSVFPSTCHRSHAILSHNLPPKESSNHNNSNALLHTLQNTINQQPHPKVHRRFFVKRKPVQLEGKSSSSAAAAATHTSPSKVSSSLTNSQSQSTCIQTIKTNVIGSPAKHAKSPVKLSQIGFAISPLTQQPSTNEFIIEESETIQLNACKNDISNAEVTSNKSLMSQRSSLQKQFAFEYRRKFFSVLSQKICGVKCASSFTRRTTSTKISIDLSEEEPALTNRSTTTSNSSTDKLIVEQSEERSNVNATINLINNAPTNSDLNNNILSSSTQIIIEEDTPLPVQFVKFSCSIQSDFSASTLPLLSAGIMQENNHRSIEEELKQQSEILSNQVFSVEESLPIIENLQDNNNNNTSLEQEVESIEPLRRENVEELKKNEEENKRKEIAAMKELVERRMGRLAVEDIKLPCCTLSIRCFLKHTFALTAADLIASKWCPKCEDLLAVAKSYAESKKGLVTSLFYAKNIHFKCAKNHTWHASNITYKHRWCNQCRNLTKDPFRGYLQAEEAKFEAECKRDQQQIYEEARHRAITNGGDQVEVEVENIATEHAKDYKKNNLTCTTPFESIREMFKIIFFPENILSLYLASLQKTELKKHYRKIAKAIHPDKNAHTKAAEAFDKLHRLYLLALEKV